MNGVQRFLVRVLPDAWARDMERESREWGAECPECGHRRSIWELGGIRWKACGTARRLMSCPQCGGVRWHRILRRKEAVAAEP